MLINLAIKDEIIPVISGGTGSHFLIWLICLLRNFGQIRECLSTCEESLVFMLP